MGHKELGALLRAEERAGSHVRHPGGLRLGPRSIGDARHSKAPAIDTDFASGAPAAALGGQLANDDFRRIGWPRAIEKSQAKRRHPRLDGDAAQLDRMALDA